MRQLAIAFAIAALPALASAQSEEEPEGDVIFVDSSEVEIVVEEEDPGTPFVEHEESLDADQEAQQTQQAPPPPPQGQAQVNLTVPAPPQVQLDQRALLRQRLAEHPLGGPITMLAVGIPVAAIFGYGAYLAYHVEDGLCALSESCGEPNRRAAAVLGTIAGAGLVLGTVGLISLIIRVGKRGRIRAQYARGELADLATGTIRF